MKKTQKEKTLELVQLAMLTALVIVLQILSALIPTVGGVSITLTLIPVVIGAILFGIRGGTILGFTFGLIVIINCITGLDPGGNFLFNANPIATVSLCVLKCTMAGFVPAVVYSSITKKKTLGDKGKFFSTLLAAMLSPIVNTLIFVIGAFIFFNDTLALTASAAAEGKSILLYIITTMAGINFLVEFIINIALTPAIIRIVDVIKKKRQV